MAGENCGIRSFAVSSPHKIFSWTVINVGSVSTFLLFQSVHLINFCVRVHILASPVCPFDDVLYSV
jgi:hypothetical protein